MRPKIKRRFGFIEDQVVVFISEKRSITVYDPDVNKIRRLIHKAYQAGWDDHKSQVETI